MTLRGFILIGSLLLATGLVNGCASATASADTAGGKDRNLAVDAQDRLRDDTVTGRYTWGVEVENSVVTLSGFVRDPAARVRAVAVLRSTPGIKGVIDEVRP